MRERFSENRERREFVQDLDLGLTLLSFSCCYLPGLISLVPSTNTRADTLAAFSRPGGREEKGGDSFGWSGMKGFNSSFSSSPFAPSLSRGRRMLSNLGTGKSRLFRWVPRGASKLEPLVHTVYEALMFSIEFLCSPPKSQIALYLFQFPFPPPLSHAQFSNQPPPRSLEATQTLLGLFFCFRGGGPERLVSPPLAPPLAERLIRT